MSEDRFKEAFRRIVSETPEAPAFSELDTYQAGPTLSIQFMPWMAAVGASLLVMVVVGAVGLLGGGGPDVAGAALIDYVKIEYSSTVELVCESGTIVDNGGFDEATIEIWGPNADDLTLMVATFPDGSTERMIVQGDPRRPTQAWTTESREDVFYSTRFRTVFCGDLNEGRVESAKVVLGPPYEPPLLPYTYLGLPDSQSWYDGVDSGDIEEAEYQGLEAFRLFLDHRIPANETYDIYVSADDPKQLLSYVMTHEEPDGARSSMTLTADPTAKVDASQVSFSTRGMTAILEGQIADSTSTTTEFDPGPEDCPITIPSQGFVPPEGYPATPADPGMIWFGKDELWTALPGDGLYRPRKSVWWSVNFPGGGEEETPEIRVEYLLLNSGRNLTLGSEVGTNAYTDDDGWFMIADIDPNASGCWQVTATYKGASLSYVYSSTDGADPATLGIVPDVLGMTVQRAGNVLHNAGYEAAPFDSDDSTYEVCAQEPGAGQEINPGVVVGLRTAPAGQCDDLMNPVLGFNRDYETYEDEFGRLFYRTACPAADVSIGGGLISADGLPQLGQTWRDRVESTLFANTEYWLSQSGVLSVAAVSRNGYVWSGDEIDDVVVTQVVDYMVEVTIDETYPCPTAPYSWNGIPVAFYIADTE